MKKPRPLAMTQEQLRAQQLADAIQAVDAALAKYRAALSFTVVRAFQADGSVRETPVVRVVLL